MSEHVNEQNDSGGFSERVEKVHTAWDRMFLLFGLLTEGLGVFLQGKIQEALTFWQIVWLTLPLTVAVAVIAYRVVAKLSITVTGIVWTVVATFFASVIAGISSGTRVATALFSSQDTLRCLQAGTCDQQSDPWPVLFFKILRGYYQVYGPLGIVRSLVAGIFIAVGINYLTRRSKPISA